jgi:hypothetical protein
MPVPFVSACHRLAHQFLPHRNHFSVPHKLRRVDEPQWNVGRSKIPVGHKVIEIARVTSEETLEIAPRTYRVVTLESNPRHKGNARMF